MSTSTTTRPGATALYRPHAETPARLTRRPCEASGAWSELKAETFEVVSRGDFVNGWLALPSSGSASGLVLALHDAGASATDGTLDAAAEWARAGCAVARIDLPLHGRRASPKLSARLVQGVNALAAGETLDADTRALVEECARQSVSDVLRTLEAGAAESDLGGDRVAIVGVGLGAFVAAWTAPHAKGLATCALAGGIGRLADADFDPAPALEGAEGETAFLFEACVEGGRTPGADQDALFGALPEPRERITADAGVTGLGKAMCEAIAARLRG